MDNKNDIIDALLYAAAPTMGKKELELYDSVDPNIKMSPKAERRILKRLKREAKYAERHKVYRPAVEVMKRAAIIVLVIMSIGFAGVISVEAARESLFDFIIEWYEKSIFFKYELDDDGMPNEITEYKEPVVGEEYARFEIAKNKYRYSLEYVSGGKVITYNQNLLNHYAFKLADNYSEFFEISVNGGEGVLTTYVSDGVMYTIIMWNDGRYLYRLSGSTDTVDKDELIRMAESINQ